MNFNIIDYSIIVYIAGIVCLLLGGLMPALIARSKTNSFFKFYIFGLFLLFPAMITALAMKEKTIKDSWVLRAFRAIVYILGSLIGTYYLIASSVYWFDYSGVEIDASIIILALTIVYLAFMVSSLISVAFIYIIRVPLYKLAEKMADSLQKLNKTKQKEDDMFAGIIDPYLVEIIKDLPRFFLSVFNWLPILNSQNKTREHKNNIKNTYGTESHSYAGNIKNLDSKPFALTYEGKEYLEEKICNCNTEKYITLLNNKPCFSDSDKRRTDRGFYFEKLDAFDRPIMAIGILDKNCRTAMHRNDNERKAVSPPGFVNNEFYGFLKNDQNKEGSLYDRCHLIAYRFCGDEANDLNMVTGTRQLNILMRDHFEGDSSEVVRAIQKGFSVLYRITPFYINKADTFYYCEIVPRGLEIEAYSIEDKGKSVCKHEFIFNRQDGVSIKYIDGSSTPLR